MNSTCSCPEGIFNSFQKTELASYIVICSLSQRMRKISWRSMKRRYFGDQNVEDMQSFSGLSEKGMRIRFGLGYSN